MRPLALVVSWALALAACGAGAPDHPHVATLATGEARYQALLAHVAHADSVAELVPRLDPDLRANFTFVYATRSAQRGIDPQHPRVVLFGTDARVVLAFTGDGPDRDVLELLRYRDDTRAFELAQFVLPAAARRDPALAKLAAGNGRANPTACLACHGADPRPIFDTYPVWPGFYGSAQDSFDQAPADELASYRRFLAGKAGVYAELAFPPGSEVTPYSLATAESPTGKLAPNMRLGMALTERNRERIARMLEASPAYARYRDKLVAGLLGCVAMPIAPEARGHVLVELTAENATKLDRAKIADPKVRHKLRMLELASAANVAELDYAARVLDVSRADWSMAMEPGALGLFDGILSSRVVDGERARDFYIKEDFLYELIAEAAHDRTLATAFARKPYAIHDRVGMRLDLPRAIHACDQFATRSAATPWPTLAPSPPAVVFRCVRCHEKNGDGPDIPFDRPNTLHAALTPDLVGAITARISDADPTNRMPLNEPPLSPSEHDALIAYVSSLQ